MYWKFDIFKRKKYFEWKKVETAPYLKQYSVLMSLNSLLPFQEFTAFIRCLISLKQYNCIELMVVL